MAKWWQRSFKRGRYAHQRIVWLLSMTALLGGARAVQGDIVSVVGTYTSIDVVFDITFTEPSLPQNGWLFQIFFDTDNNLNTGYGAGYERLVRGVEYATPLLIHYRSTVSGSGPGGWGTSLTTLPVVWLDDHHVQVTIVLATAGLSTGNIRYTVEAYKDGRLVDEVRLARTVAATLSDCNHNGIADSIDISTGTSEDCNGNQVPDECDVAGGITDCNSNGNPDNCDISSGFSTDCSGDGVPDECEVDCNNNGIGDSCDITDGTSEDCDANMVPDECEPVAVASGCRWISVHPPAGPRKVAIRVTGNAQDPTVGCVSRFVQANGSLGATAVYQFPQEWCTAYVHGAAIAPNKTYTVQLIDGVTFFPPRVVTTPKWGDVDRSGLLNVTDIQAIVLYISGKRSFEQEAVDIGPCIPDGFVNVTDVQTAVLAFSGLPYSSSACAQPCP